ncbi:MAG: cation diffusion facilitator CzcD-associated flavoprotein CzcO [Candidatus Azotimanducaceae bacterium]|jgi:cation diffusion facilitator CzcD-associated flavoprotein CzcO
MPKHDSQEYYDEIKTKFAAERDIRVEYRPEGTQQYTSDLDGDLAHYAVDPFAEPTNQRDPINDNVEVLFIGGGFSALLTSARLREKGVESIRIVERGGDVGGTWYWNRYPGVACDVVAYDYLPLLDELDYVPVNHYSRGPEIFGHCQAIAKKYDLYDLAVFQTTVTETLWNEEEGLWHIKTNRGDHMRAQFVICANGTLSKPKLSKIDGMESFKGHAFHTSRWDYDYTGHDLGNLKDKVVGIVGTGASAVQAVPELAKQAKELYVFQRTPSSIDIREDWPTDPNWARTLKSGWQSKRRERVLAAVERTPEQKAKLDAMSAEEKLQYQENQNIDYMMRIHRRIEKTVQDPETAESLKPWYMFMCKRPCFHNDYLPSFNQSNVHLVDTHGKGITEISQEGPVFEDETYKLDLLIYATGFEVQKTGIYNRIVGRNGQDLEDKYDDGVRTLLGIHTHGFPNLFIMGGYQASFQFNLTDMLQTQGDHIAECINYTRDHGYQTMDPTADAEEWWVQEVISHRGKTNRNQECTPGYYNFEGESNRRQDGNYNGGFRQYFLHQGAVRENMANNFEFSSAKPAATNDGGVGSD